MYCYILFVLALVQIDAFSNVSGLLAHVNTLRAIHNVAPFSYNTSLETGAHAWANVLGTNRKLEHSSTEFGENLAAGSGSYAFWTCFLIGTGSGELASQRTETRVLRDRVENIFI